MIKDTIAVDVDEVLANASSQWQHWLEQVTGVKLHSQPTSYNLASYFSEELSYEGMTGFEFWKGDDPYKDVKPVEGAVRACEELSKNYRLLPVSKIYTEHGCSKRKWLKKWFPMLEPPVYISQDGTKSDVKCSWIIDDRLENFKGFVRGETQGVLLNTPYLTPCKVDIPYVICDDWVGILQHFKEMED